MQLRPYQEEAKQAIFDEWNKGINRTLLVLPTGCGKTIVFAKVTEEQVKQGDRVLILAHRFELLQQACDKIEQATGLKSAMEKAEYTCMGSWYRVVVGSVQTLMREKRLNGFAKVEARKCFYLPENAHEFDFSEYDYVVDAGDTVTAKLEIIMCAKECNVPVIS